MVGKRLVVLSDSIVPSNAPRINIFEPQSKVSAGMFDKGRDLATKLQGGAYPNSVRANMLRSQITSGADENWSEVESNLDTIPYYDCTDVD